MWGSRAGNPTSPYLDSGWVPTVDLLLVESRLPPDFYRVIDDRQRDTAFLREHFSRRYRFWRRRLVKRVSTDSWEP
jgi:hypothetical protein